MERKFRISDDLFTQIFETKSLQLPEELEKILYSVIEKKPIDNEVCAEKYSESTIDDVFSIKNTLKIINLE